MLLLFGLDQDTSQEGNGGPNLGLVVYEIMISLVVAIFDSYSPITPITLNVQLPFFNSGITTRNQGCKHILSPNLEL